MTYERASGSAPVRWLWARQGRRSAWQLRVDRAAATLLAIRGSWRLPVAWRRWMATRATTRVLGSIPDKATALVTIVSHELGAAGAPKVLTEVIDACVASGWAPLVVAPDDGPYAQIFADHGALVVVNAFALTDLSPAIGLAAMSDAVLCNTVVCLDLIRHLPVERTAWYLHETGLIDRIRADRPDFADRLNDVADVWTASPLVSQRLIDDRPNVFTIGASCLPVSRGRRPGSADDVNAVVLGSIESRKGQDLIVEAYRALPVNVRDRLSIAFHGRQIEPAFARDTIARIETTPGLHHGGAVSPAAAAEALTEADVLIVSSRDEPLPLVAIEALSAGRVVICSRAAGISCYLQDGVDAYIAASASADDLRDVVVRAMRDRSAWPRIARAGEDAYARHFAPAAFRGHVIARLRRIIERQDRRRG